MSTYSPAREMQAAVVAMLRADGTLTTPGGLLYPAYSPRLEERDYRVYEASAELPEDPAIRSALPRIYIDTAGFALQFEQDDPDHQQMAVTVYPHVVVRKEDGELGDAITTRVAKLFLSTRLSSDRIIAAELVPEGDWRRGRIAAFDNAWEYVAQFRTANVGVLAS